MAQADEATMRQGAARTALIPAAGGTAGALVSLALSGTLVMAAAGFVAGALGGGGLGLRTAGLAGPARKAPSGLGVALLAGAFCGALVVVALIAFELIRWTPGK
jgi:hypothetical protein